MHDCRKMQRMVVDLMFNELPVDKRSRILSELDHCVACQDFYGTMTRNLVLYDHAIAASLPPEGYWEQYERRLRARLAYEVEPRPGQTATFPLGRHHSLPRVSVATAALFLLVMAALLVGTLRHNDKPEKSTPSVVARTQSDAERPAKQNGLVPLTASGSPDIRSNKLRERSSNIGLLSPVPGTARVQNKPMTASREQLELLSREEARFPTLLESEVAGHIEGAQVLLRSLRNIQPIGPGPALDVSFEKRLANELIVRNIVLRRSANLKRAAALDELLDTLEPILLDITHLQDIARRDDVDSINERIQKENLITDLQLYSPERARSVF